MGGASPSSAITASLPSSGRLCLDPYRGDRLPEIEAIDSKTIDHPVSLPSQAHSDNRCVRRCRSRRIGEWEDEMSWSFGKRQRRRHDLTEAFSTISSIEGFIACRDDGEWAGTGNQHRTITMGLRFPHASKQPRPGSGNWT